MKRRFGIIFGLALVTAVPSVILAASTAPRTVLMKALNGSGQSGTATIARAYNGKQTVTIQLTGEPAGANEPAHIHPGACPNPNPVPKVVLMSVVNGKSVTKIPAMTSMTGKWSIVVHKGPGADAKVYVSCGDIP